MLSQYRAPYERPPPGSPLTYGQTSRGDYTSGSTSTQRTAYMAPRPRQVMVHLCLESFNALIGRMNIFRLVVH
ncbi:hypothetical protein GLOIN_2v575193 [Rhizophagus irregularis DAOM 181602=DAOM 197198]|nr:hypothetical protein GLOIN_2v575193 [Rhizophagus irregularis DAOM 181602=DAOM 197198]